MDKLLLYISFLSKSVSIRTFTFAAKLINWLSIRIFFPVNDVDYLSI